jgi:hypothetical protein
MISLRQLIAAAQVHHPCSQGHDWQSVGGRPCSGVSGATGCQGSQPVYQCARCGNYDYGHPHGPGFEDCVANCGAKL